MVILDGSLTTRTPGRRIATVGMFDGVHPGHRHLIQQLIDAGAARGLTPMVITFCNHPLSVIAPQRPIPPTITTTEEKVELLGGTGVAECLALKFDEELMSLSASEFLRLLHVNYGVETFIAGFNNRFGNDLTLSHKELSKIAQQEGVEFLTATRMPGDNSTLTTCSSTVRDLINTKGDVATAALILGRKYAFSGRVVHGKELGRRIGYPTANVSVTSPDKLIPLSGVYACEAELADRRVYPAMVNIGYRPTIDDGDERSIEAHIIGLDEDIYGMEITLRFQHRIREEKKFASLEDLQEQLAADRKKTTEIVNL